MKRKKNKGVNHLGRSPQESYRYRVGSSQMSITTLFKS